jgi:hypothetical protein
LGLAAGRKEQQICAYTDGAAASPSGKSFDHEITVPALRWPATPPKRGENPNQKTKKKLHCPAVELRVTCSR